MPLVLPYGKQGASCVWYLRSLLALAACASAASAQVPGEGCIDPPICGAWETAFDWDITTCGSEDEDSECDSVDCPNLAYGEVPHAVLVLKDPAANPAEWRVLLVNTGNPDTSQTDWWVWDPATPTVVDQGLPFHENAFCGGHTVLRDGRVFFAGGHRYPANGGECSTAASHPKTWVYDPTDGPLGTWSVGPDMTHPRYYPTCVGDTEDAVIVLGGQGGPSSMEIYHNAPSIGTFEGPYAYSTVPECGSLYPHTHILPKRPPAGGQTFRATLFVSSAFYYSDLWPCSSGGYSIPTQLLPLRQSPPDYSLAWQVGPAPTLDLDRAENGSLLLVDTTLGTPQATVFIAAGQANPFDDDETATAEAFVNPQNPTVGVPLPSVNIARFYASFMMLPGRRILALGGDTTNPLFPKITTPEWLDLANLSAGWEELGQHVWERPYHSWALLLPDGRVLHGGGRKKNNEEDNYRHAEIFNPPYDKDGAATRKARFGPGNLTTMPYGSQQVFHMATVPPEGIWEFELLRPGSMTHTTDFDQRMVLVPHVNLGSGDYRITAPASSDLAPPGWYMLFAVSNDGVPSVAHFVHLP
jgi:hypothetical protein